MGKPTLFLAAGHGGADPGNTASGLCERDELIAFTATLRDWYRAMSVPVELGGAIFLDDALALEGELAVLNKWNLKAVDNDLAVDLHLDYKPGASGALILFDESEIGKQVGGHFLLRWCQATGIHNNGIFRSSEVAGPWRGWDDFGFCRPRWPGIIIELGCINSASDMQVIRHPMYRALAGQFLWEAWRAFAAGELT